MADRGPRSVLVTGVGNDLRHDDGAGITIARRLRDGGAPPGVEVGEEQGEPVGLLDAWQGRDAVILVDTMRSGATPGTIRRFDATNEPLPGRTSGSASTHALALAEAIELGRALHRLPARVVVYAIEGERFDVGAGLSDAVDAAAPALLEAVLGEARALSAGGAPRDPHRVAGE